MCLRAINQTAVWIKVHAECLAQTQMKLKVLSYMCQQVLNELVESMPARLHALIKEKGRHGSYEEILKLLPFKTLSKITLG